MFKLWIDLQGNVIPVRDSHEEWANEHGYELEDLLAKGWVRVQNVPPQYLYLDFKLQMNEAQVNAVRMLFENQFEKAVVEFDGEDRTFTDREEALKYVLGRELRQ